MLDRHSLVLIIEHPPVRLVLMRFSAYTTNANLGSPAKVYDLLTQAAKAHPVSGNADGSYLTMRSQEGAIFFVINLVGNFGTVFMDNGRSSLGSYAQPKRNNRYHQVITTKLSQLAPSMLFQAMLWEVLAGSLFRGLPLQRWVFQLSLLNRTRSSPRKHFV